MTKTVGGWGQTGELPDQVTQTGGQSLGQRPLPQTLRPPGWRDSCSRGQQRRNTLHLSLLKARFGCTIPLPTEDLGAGPPVPPPSDRGVQDSHPLLLQGPFLSSCPECVCSQEGAVPL